MSSAPIIPFWNYQSQYAWTSTDGILTDQSRLWIQTLYRRVMSTSGGGAGFTAGGDLSGTNTNQTVIGLQTRHVSTTAPTNGQVLTWVTANNDWEPQSIPGAALVEEVPAGTMDGANVLFTLSFAPNPVNSLTLYLNGVEQIKATDFTISGAILTYTVPPKSDDLMIAKYTH